MLSLWDILDHRQPWALKFQRAEVRMKEAVFSRVLQIAYQSEIGLHKQKGSTPGPNRSIMIRSPGQVTSIFHSMLTLASRRGVGPASLPQSPPIHQPVLLIHRRAVASTVLTRQSVEKSTRFLCRRSPPSGAVIT